MFAQTKVFLTGPNRKPAALFLPRATSPRSTLFASEWVRAKEEELSLSQSSSSALCFCSAGIGKMCTNLSSGVGRYNNYPSIPAFSPIPQVFHSMIAFCQFYLNTALSLSLFRQLTAIQTHYATGKKSPGVKELYDNVGRHLMDDFRLFCFNDCTFELYCECHVRNCRD